MSSSNTTAYTVLRPAAKPKALRGHIGDLPHDILHRILVWKLLANGEVPAVVAFVIATPFLADQAGHAGGTQLLAACGLDWTNILWQQDVDFWQKFRTLRRAQRRERVA